MTDNIEQIDSEPEAKALGETDAELWRKKIEAAKTQEEDWREEAREAIKVYEADKESKTVFNIFHSNVETMMPALYNTTPIPDVRRRYNDKDPVAKLASDIVERALSYSVDQYPFDSTVRKTTKSGFVPGRGTARIVYDAEEEEKQGVDGAAYSEVVYEEIRCKPVAWDKWGHGPGECWDDVPFVYFEHNLDKEEVIDLLRETYGDDASQIEKRLETLAFGNEKDGDGKEQKSDRGIVKTLPTFEIWDKRKRQVYWIPDEADEDPLTTYDDPLGLPGFFPVPEPIQAVRRVSSLVPVCPYQVYRHLIDEADRITKRINKLVGQLRVRGIADGEIIKDLDRLKTAEDGEYIEANDATRFSASGKGIDGAVSHWPLDPTVAALQQLYLQREQVKALIYEVTGISDILRGASDARETASAQQIKTQWGSLRIQDLQGEVARFARDLFRMKASIMCRRFTPQTISVMTGLPQTEKDQQLFPQALALLKNEAHRGFRIDIESDSTVRADLSRSQEQMNLFLAGTAQYAQAMLPLIEVGGQQVLPVIVEIYTSFARHFKLGKQAEDALESLTELAQQAVEAAQQQQEEPSPEEREAALEEEKAKREMQRDEEKHELDVASKVVDLQATQAENEMDLEHEEKKNDLEFKRMRMQRSNEQ